MVHQEILSKQERALRQRLGQAKFPLVKTLDNFEFSFNASIPKQKILKLAEGDFVSQKENIILLGPPGVGKTHLALAIAYAACQKGTKTFFVTAADLINNLYASLADHSLERQLRTFTTPKLLVIDEVGFLPFDQKGADLFFQSSLQGLGGNLPQQHLGRSLDRPVGSSCRDYQHQRRLIPCKGKEVCLKDDRWMALTKPPGRRY